MRRCELEDTGEPIVEQLTRAGFDTRPGGYTVWVTGTPLHHTWLCYQAEFRVEEDIVTRMAEIFGLLPLVAEPQATVSRREG